MDDTQHDPGRTLVVSQDVDPDTFGRWTDLEWAEEVDRHLAGNGTVTAVERGSMQGQCFLAFHVSDFRGDEEAAHRAVRSVIADHAAPPAE